MQHDLIRVAAVCPWVMFVASPTPLSSRSQNQQPRTTKQSIYFLIQMGQICRIGPKCKSVSQPYRRVWESQRSILALIFNHSLKKTLMQLHSYIVSSNRALSSRVLLYRQEMPRMMNPPNCLEGYLVFIQPGFPNYFSRHVLSRA